MFFLPQRIEWPSQKIQHTVEKQCPVNPFREKIQDANMTGQSDHSMHVIATFYDFNKVVKYSCLGGRN